MWLERHHTCHFKKVSYKKDWDTRRTFQELKKTVWLLIGCSVSVGSLRDRLLHVTFGELSRKTCDGKYLKINWFITWSQNLHLSGVKKKIKPRPLKEVLVQLSTTTPVSLHFFSRNRVAIWIQGLSQEKKTLKCLRQCLQLTSLLRYSGDYDDYKPATNLKTKNKITEGSASVWLFVSTALDRSFS